MLNGNVDEAGCRVVYVSDAPMSATRSQMLFEDYPDLLTPAHLSEITGQCEATIRSLCGRGKLPAVRIGKRWYVPKTAMAAFVNGNSDA
mgnify:CR=1 FL=1